MDATTGALIGIGVTLGVAVLLQFFKVLTVGFLPAYSEGATTKTVFDFSFINWFKILYYFLPYGLFLFGVIYDGLIRKIKFFPA
jgi:hypothetical protein